MSAPAPERGRLRQLLARNGVFLRVFLAIGASAIVAVALSGALFWVLLDNVWEDLYDRDLGNLESRVERAVQTQSVRGLQSQMLRQEGIVLVVLRDKRPVGLSPPRWLMRQLEHAREHHPEELERRVQRYVYAEFSDGAHGYQIILIPNVRSVWRMARPLGVVFALLTLVLASAWIAWMLTRPLRVLSRSTKQLAEGDLQARVPLSVAGRQDAVGQLGSEFNRMAERVDGLLGSQQQLLRDVSHELRTPLARLQVALTLAQDEPEKGPAMLGRMEAELERLDSLIGQVLSLSRLQSGADTLNLEPVDLVPLLEDVGSNAEFEFADKDVHLRLTAQAARLRGDREKLASAFENIVRNAMRYAPEGSAVTLHVAQLGQQVTVTVSDRGPGVEESKLERLFEAFYRVDGARETSTGGHGVGLAISKEAVARHGGTLRARNLEGGGLEVSVSLPLGPS
ncbi:MAG: ATP-binding protein [Pseudomonadota bacterium]